ncbi:MAG: hypothetical protein V7L26_15235 [Nostoc sp.]|uniref:hypothetical protein n=1 Tax=Nostoc sp. TaxID=1180 RepID=UPI002FEEA450
MRRRLGGGFAKANRYQDVGFGKASNATCYNALNPRNAVAPQPTIFLQHFSLDTPLQYLILFKNQIVILYHSKLISIY